jgi:hypothetical protein
MSKNNQQPHSENPNNQFSSSEPMTFAQKIQYVKNMKMTNNKQQIKPFWKGFCMGWMSFYLLFKLIESL